ncbi:MAG: DUF72 domain-containing protein [Planctomycetota bacterium]
MSADQLQLFGLPPERHGPVRAAEQPPELLALAARLAPGLRLGTSSWSFPGWEGLVYDRPASEARLAREGLRAYAGHPLFRTVGVDRGFYAPVQREAWEAYARDVPQGFSFLVKALGELTTPLLPPERAGGRVGVENPRFLSPELCNTSVLAPLEPLGALLGPLLFQFPPLDLVALGGPRALADRLGAFLDALPRGPLYAVELRNAAALTPDYADALASVGAVHCLNVHPTMPSPAEQVARLGARWRQAPAVVVRWMLGAGLRYQAAKERYQPFDRLVDPDPGTRAGLAALLRADARPTWAVINNKAEGSSPRSVVELARALAAEPGE